MPISPRETLLCRYRYDPLDRSIDWAPDRQASIQRFYCKSRLATEIQGAAKYSFLQHENQVLAQQRHTGDKVDTALLATDQQHSVLNALDATQSHPLAYTPYGHRPFGNGLLSLHGFNGERPDPVTGHYHLGNGYRQFNPGLMRFNSPDSWSPFGKGGLNAYMYCGADPINRSDPTGHFARLPGPLNATGKILAGAILAPVAILGIAATTVSIIGMAKNDGEMIRDGMIVLGSGLAYGAGVIGLTRLVFNSPARPPSSSSTLRRHSLTSSGPTNNSRYNEPSGHQAAAARLVDPASPPFTSRSNYSSSFERSDQPPSYSSIFEQSDQLPSYESLEFARMPTALPPANSPPRPTPSENSRSVFLKAHNNNLELLNTDIRHT